MIIDFIFENQPKQEEDQRRIGRGGTCWSSMHQRSACRIGYHYPNCALCMLPYWVKNIAWGEFVPHPSPNKFWDKDTLWTELSPSSPRVKQDVLNKNHATWFFCPWSSLLSLQGCQQDQSPERFSKCFFLQTCYSSCFCNVFEIFCQTHSLNFKQD